jgi:hypothetical protein
MTFQDLEETLPNGFDDAQLKSLLVDYVGRRLASQMEILVGTPEAGDRHEYRAATLTVTGVYFCVIEPPDVKYPFGKEHKPIWISGDNAWPDALSHWAATSALANPGLTYHRFFCNDWNSFIYIAADDVLLSWN